MVKLSACTCVVTLHVFRSTNTVSASEFWQLLARVFHNRGVESPLPLPNLYLLTQ